MDPNLDPELALALRVSMEEERARQEAAARRAADDSTKSIPEGGEGSTQIADVAMTDAIPAPQAVPAAEKDGDFMVTCQFPISILSQPIEFCEST